MGFRADGGCIDIDDASVEIAKGSECGVNVPRVDRGGQAVGNVVGKVNSLLEIVDRNDRDNRAEDFFLSDAHLGMAISEDRRLVEPAVRMIPLFQAMAADG